MAMKLTSRDTALLDTACRHRILTVDVTTAICFPGGAQEAARSLLRRLEGGGYLSRHRFTQRESYYQPMDGAFALFGDPQSKARPIGAQTLPRLLGVLLFSCLSHTRGIRLRPTEIRAVCPDLGADHPALTAIQDFVRFDSTGEVTRVVVDLGGNHRAFAFKVRTCVGEMLRERAYRDLVSLRQLTLTLVFATQSKRDAVQRTLGRQLMPLAVRFVVVEQLFELLSGTPQPADEGVA